MNPEPVYYDEQIDYKRDLLERIIAINKAIECGGDGVKPLTLLWTELKTDIQTPIFVKIQEQAESLIKAYAELETKIIEGSPSKVSMGHRNQILLDAARPLIQQTVLICKNIIINQLDEMGLLLRDARQIPVGNMKRFGGS